MSTWKTEIEREHDEQRVQLEQLEDALLADPPDVRRALELVLEIDRGLPEHLAREEAVVSPWVARVLPETQLELDRLEREHVQLFTGITSLRYALAGVTPQADLGAGVRFVRFFRDHMEREHRLVEQALLRGVVEPAA